jgi:hypothetical protein
VHALAAELPRTILNIGVGTRQTLLIVTGKDLINRPPCALTSLATFKLRRFQNILIFFRVITQTLLPKCLASEEKLFVSLSHWATISKSVLQQYGGPFDGGHPDCCDSTS